MQQQVIHYLRAGYAGLYIISAEEQRTEADLKSIAQLLNFSLYAWSVTEGLLDLNKNSAREANEMEVLMLISDLPEKSLIVLRDYHQYLNDNPVIIRKLKDVLQIGKTQNKTVIILGCRLCLPPELEHELTVIERVLPGKLELGIVLDGVIESAQIPVELAARETLLDAASGLTTIEAENAFALSVVESRSLNAGIVAREKAQAVKKNGLLEIIETKETLESIGGLDVLKTWLLKRKNAFSKQAQEYGLPTPKGLLILGIAGTGKSLCAKATAKVFGVPLLKLDAGRIFAGLVGQSEANLRSVIQTAEAIAPCCLWIDELEKAFSGSKSSGATDGGTSARVFGSFLSWMQEKTKAVFVVATANDVSQLPPEMLRKGRWDELFFVDLPNQAERETIWAIQIRKRSRDERDFDLVQLARMTEGLTGAEIEACFVESLFLGFDSDREPTDLDIAGILTDFVPLSKTMSEQIGALRQWAKGRARMATSLVMEKRGRKMVV